MMMLFFYVVFTVFISCKCKFIKLKNKVAPYLQSYNKLIERKLIIIVTVNRDKLKLIHYNFHTELSTI